MTELKGRNDCYSKQNSADHNCHLPNQSMKSYGDFKIKKYFEKIDPSWTDKKKSLNGEEKHILKVKFCRIK